MDIKNMALIFVVVVVAFAAIAKVLKKNKKG